jgi:hypothetical protein
MISERVYLDGGTNRDRFGWEVLNDVDYIIL